MARHAPAAQHTQSKNLRGSHEAADRDPGENAPPLYGTEETPLKDKLAVVKFFDPSGRGTWYGVEYDPEERRFFGFVTSPLGPDCDEWGYFSLDELAGVRGRFGLGIERDCHWDPKTPMNQILNAE